MKVPCLLLPLCWAVILAVAPATGRAQAPEESAAASIKERLSQLQQEVEKLKETDPNRFHLADVEVYAKAVEWALRHNEFYSPAYTKYALAALETGLARAAELAKGNAPWDQRTGRAIRGYYSLVDGSVQPYAISVPASFDPKKTDRWPVHLVLHGRGDKLNEISFINQHDNKPADAEQTWIQIDVFGRTNNAYRWSGETDVFEALNAVRRLFRVDDRRIVLRGFSMGGAGAWHLGLHYPSEWCSVGPGAGFVDFYDYQKVKEKLPPFQDKTLRIYDAIDYVQNAFNVPICTYGGEQDAQLVASTKMVEAAEKLGIDIKLVIGKGVGHKFTPEGFKEYMDFHNARMEQGRKGYPGARKIKFTTYTLKYNTCEWLTIEEMIEPYEKASVEAEFDSEGVLQVKTENVAVLRIGRDLASDVVIDGTKLPLTTAADGLLPDVFYSVAEDAWGVIGYDSSLTFMKNLDVRKRKNLQGPIDDAFMQSFICVRGTGTPWSQAQHDWAAWTLDRFDREFDKWLRGKIRIVDDTDVTEKMMQDNHLILFGDPGSNSILAKVAHRLPVKWTKEEISVEGKTCDPQTHGLSLIYPNPLAPRNYIVVNSGHTFHEPQFRASNAQLYPRLGDIAVQKFTKSGDGYQEEIIWADLFDSNWTLRPPVQRASK